MMSYGQRAGNFKQTKEFYLHGNTAVTGNNSLSDHKTKPFNDPRAVNDQQKMRYIDIDADKTTFSSSAADLIVPENSTIKYAALYWAATYPGAEGKKKAEGNKYVYELTAGRKQPINKVLIKLPGQRSYSSIAGEIVHDGFKSGVDLEDNCEPFVCYSDITDLVKLNGVANGTYTVANIPALEGFMYGGSSAGWMLYVIYENQEQPLQYITSYHGFEFIDLQNPVILNFDHFQSAGLGKTETALTIGALEGDNLLKRDQVSLYNEQLQKFVAITTPERPASNFFNSTINSHEGQNLNRKPNSMNTLGFDIAQIDSKNVILANNANNAKLEFTTRADRYFIYFTAFQTTISEQFYEEIKAVKFDAARLGEQPEESVLNTEQKNLLIDAALKARQKMKADTSEETPEEKIEKQPKEEAKVEVKEEKVKETPKPTVTKTETKIAEPQKQTATKAAPKNYVVSSTFKIPEMEGGYYIISNVFSQKANATRWIESLKELGFAPKTFTRSQNNFTYVYLEKSQDPVALYKKIKEIRKLKDLEQIWMLKIN